MSGTRDENDRLRDGTLPRDPEDDAKPIAHTKRAGHAAVDTLADVASERALIGALLWCGANAPETLNVSAVSDLLESAEAFSTPAHKAIFSVITSLKSAKVPPDPVAVHAELVRRHEDDVAGGSEYLSSLLADASTVSEAKARGFAQSIRDAWVRRRLVQIGAEITKLAKTGKVSAEEGLATSQKLLADLAPAIAAERSFVRVSAPLANIIRTMSDGKKLGVPTGFAKLDAAIGGLFPNNVTVLAARTSVGKSALATQIAFNIAKDPALAVLYVSLEMPAESFLRRVLSARSEVPAKLLKWHAVKERDDQARVVYAAKEIATAHVYFADTQIQTFMSIQSMAAKLTAKLAKEGVKLALVIVDHVGIVKPSSDAAKKNKEQQVSEVSRGLRYLAEQFSCHAMGIAQINRGPEQRKGKDRFAKLSDMRDSDTLAQDPDNVLILHREFDEMDMPVPGKPATLTVAKARDDERTKILLRCDPEYVRFSEWTGEY